MNDKHTPPPPNDDDEARFAPPDDALPDIFALDDDGTLDDLDALARELESSGLSADNVLAPEPTVSLSKTTAMPAAPDDEADDAPNPYTEPTVSLEPTMPLSAAPDDVDALPPLGDFDVENALGGLDAVVARHEAEEQLEQDEAERVQAILDNPMPLPEPLVLERGSLPGLLPALGLIGLGVWLTVANTTADGVPPPLIGAALVGLFALGLLLTWLNTGRWNRGALFLSIGGLLAAGTTVYVSNTLDATALPPALVMALGSAFVLSGLFARPLSAPAMLAGLMLIVGGGVTLAYTMGLVPPLVTDSLRTGWILVAALVVLVLSLPIIRRVRG